LADVPALVASAKAAGSKVSLHMDVPDDEESAAMGICVYRLVQEGLSNASRHAPGEPVDVVVTYTRKRIQVQITNPSKMSPGAEHPELQPGHGIIGMRERVAALGGTIDVRMTREGRFVVAASLLRGQVNEKLR
jgi:signal transduction histidine kinase